MVSELSAVEKAVLAKAVQELEEFIKMNNPDPYVLFFPDALKDYTLHQAAIDYMAEKGYIIEDQYQTNMAREHERASVGLQVTPDIRPIKRPRRT